jgi:tripartite-type tricarboxylate transporter receptor subunit TctC
MLLGLANWCGAVKAPEIKSKLVLQELYLAGSCGAEFAAYLREKFDTYGRIIREANIRQSESND